MHVISHFLFVYTLNYSHQLLTMIPSVIYLEPCIGLYEVH